MHSFLLKEKERQKEKEKEKKEMDLRGGGGNNNMRMSRLTPGETNGGARDLSLPIRRWQMTLLEIRKDRDLQDLLFLRLRMRGQIFGRLFLVRFEDMMRRALREELHHQLFSYLNLPQRLLSDQNIQARYRLQFTNSVKDPTFTTDQVTDKNGARIEVAIYDSYTGSIISPDCFLSSAKVRITVLDAEFWKNKGENWSGSEFNHSILEERDGKGPILTGGGLTFRLKNGRGTSGSIVFRDNSKWTKSGFRLGVMIDAEGEVNGERVREGVSEPFRVKDRRAKASQKPDLLKLEDKIQGLRSIGKDRASLLEKNNIKTVEDFLWWYYQDQHKLRMILRIKSESDNGWKTMVEHAMTCDYEFQAKYNALNDTSKPQQVSMDKHINIANPNMDQIYVDCPVNSNINSVSSLEEVLHGRILHQDQFSSEALAHMSGWNEPMLPISGLRFVGSGSSEPNPCEHNLINSGYAGPDISLTNGATQLVGLGSSEPNPHENDIIDQGDMSAYYGQLTPICDLSPVNHMTIERGNITNVDSMHNTDGDGLYPPELSTGLIPTGGDLYTDAESTLNYICQFLSRRNSFDTGLPVNFTASMSNSVYVGPLSPDRKAKRKALLKWIISPAVKRARIVPPDNQTTVLSM